jgi:hypothetical protein
MEALCRSHLNPPQRKEADNGTLPEDVPPNPISPEPELLSVSSISLISVNAGSVSLCSDGTGMQVVRGTVPVVNNA